MRLQHVFLLLGIVCCALPPCMSEAEEFLALSRGHAHNDYYHERPLVDALDQGFLSIEVDIFLVNNELLVGHDRDELTPNRTLQSLYLDPLKTRVRQYKGSVYGNRQTLTLLVDIKSDAEKTYERLQSELPIYKDMLTSVENDRISKRAIQIVLSGNRPKLAPLDSMIRFVALDGRLQELDLKFPVHQMPLVSDHWPSYFRWTGEGEMPFEERERLIKLVGNVHSQGKRLRFWATPENEAVWQELLRADVDLIGTDDLSRLASYLRKNKLSKRNRIKPDPVARDQ